MDRRKFPVVAVVALASFCLFSPAPGLLHAQETAATVSPTATVSVSAPAASPSAHDAEVLRRVNQHLEQLPPEERDTFRRNLAVWRDLPEEERIALRDQARARARAEIDKAVQDSGLHLDQDQREVFALRFSQERRKLEREIQRKAAAERARRLPEIIARIKAEFAGGPTPGLSVKPAASPGQTPDPDATPVPGFMR